MHRAKSFAIGEIIKEERSLAIMTQIERANKIGKRRATLTAMLPLRARYERNISRWFRRRWHHVRKAKTR